MSESSSDPLHSLIKRWLQSDDPDGELEAMCLEHPEHAAALRAQLSDLETTVAQSEVEAGGGGAAAAGQERPEQIGRYQVLHTLGEGGMGTVYLAEQREPVLRLVALKLIKLGMDSAAVVRRFEQERQALAMMDHEGIAKVFDCDTNERGQPYFVMELVQGSPLHRFCAAHRLELAERLGLMQQVCAAVQHAHQKGVLHRDLKPDNVLVSDVDGRRVVKVIDFGLAKAMAAQPSEASQLTEAGVVVGTPEFMAPEQADPDNFDVDTRADVYSLGVMLYQLLVGQLPFSDRDLRSLGVLERQRVLQEEAPLRPSVRLSNLGQDAAEHIARLGASASSLLRALRSDLDWVVAKALEKDRERRYESAKALADDLQRFLDHEPLEAGPPSALYRLQKLIGRHRVVVAAAGLVLLALVIGGVATYVQWQNAVELAKSERAAKDEAKVNAAKFESKVTEFNQLAVVVRYDRVQAEGMRLLEQAPWPQAQASMAEWLESCEELLAMRPGIEATLASLREQALPWDAARQGEFAAREPDAFAEWELRSNVLRSLEHAQAIRSGAAAPSEVALSPEQRELDAQTLNAMAWARVAPEPLERELWGEEAFGLALAKLAVDKAPEAAARFEYLDTLACAWLANGEDDQARKCSEAALAAAPAEQRAAYEEHLAAVVAAVEAAPQQLAAAASAYRARPVWEFAPADESQAFLHETLTGLMIQIAELERAKQFVVDERQTWSEQIERLTRAHPGARVTWSEVREGVAAAEAYAGCDVPLSDADIGARWLGLVPLGANPVTGLFEFYHLRSACDGDVAAAAEVAIPVHGEDGTIEVGEETGIVFVLLPGGRVTLGSQSEVGDYYDAERNDDETLHEVELSPFLLARHELTQGQWARLWFGSGDERLPSRYAAGQSVAGRLVTAANPVEQVDWAMSRDLMRMHGLSLPTEAQWEYGCRAGGVTPWCVGKDRLVGYANVADQSAKRVRVSWPCESWQDGYFQHAPVGSFSPNAFGLYDVHGNVWEWCLDRYGAYGSERAGDGRNLVSGSTSRVYRGGSFDLPAAYARSSHRDAIGPAVRADYLGLRPARRLFD